MGGSDAAPSEHAGHAPPLGSTHEELAVLRRSNRLDGCGRLTGCGAPLMAGEKASRPQRDVLVGVVRLVALFGGLPPSRRWHLKHPP
jgi:hypothetical protein